MAVNLADFLQSFEVDDDVAELALVDGLWYFVKKGSSWVVG